MSSGYTVFLTYALHSTGNTMYNSSAVHCNYIKSVYLNTLTNQEVNIYFDDPEEFKFLAVSGGTGFTANKIYLIVQIINHSNLNEGEEPKPNPNEWKIYDATYQLEETLHLDRISKYNMGSTLFRVPINMVQGLPIYDLDYLNYPSKNQPEKLSFGDEEIFMGNVTADVEAIAYTMDLSINLDLNEFNSTTNKTWDGQSQVYVSEIGLYNENKELIAIGKFNNPIPKNGNISRTLLFGLDF